MTAWRKQLGTLVTIGVLTLQWGCTDRRTPRAAPVHLNKQVTQTITSSAKSVASVKFQNADTEVLNMVQKTGSLFLTGRPFGFSRWDVAADAENPHLTFAASDQIDTFAPNGKWVVDWYASGGLGLLGRYAFLSGSAGMSVIDIGNTNSPREVLRKPYADPNSDQVPRDEGFVYKAIVASPYSSVLYGFREQDYVYTLRLAGGDVQLTRKDAYGGDGVNVCCVRSATVFQNVVYVAFGGRLVWFFIGSDGNLEPGGETDELQAANVASTEQYLYVQHTPTYGQQQGLKNPKGIYVFDRKGDNVDYIAMNEEPRLFTVHPRDSHLYFNLDNTSIEIFRIQWAQGGGH